MFESVHRASLSVYSKISVWVKGREHSSVIIVSKYYFFVIQHLLIDHESAHRFALSVY